MAEDRFVSEIASRVAAAVLHAIRKEGLAVGGGPPHGSKTGVRVAPKLLRVEDAAVMLARTKNSVRHLIDRGELKVVRHGRSVRIAIEDVVEFIERDRT
jgi:excisionase family DNA binding protein